MFKIYMCFNKSFCATYDIYTNNNKYIKYLTL